MILEPILQRGIALLTLWLQITVDEAHEMQVFQSGGNFRGIESRSILVDALVGAGL